MFSGHPSKIASERFPLTHSKCNRSSFPLFCGLFFCSHPWPLATVQAVHALRRRNAAGRSARRACGTASGALERSNEDAERALDPPPHTWAYTIHRKTQRRSVRFRTGAFAQQQRSRATAGLEVSASNGKGLLAIPAKSESWQMQAGRARARPCAHHDELPSGCAGHFGWRPTGPIRAASEAPRLIKIKTGQRNKK